IVIHEIIRQFHKEKIIYIGNTLTFPYRPSQKKEVKKFTWEMVRFLLKKNIKMLIVACNTATAFALTELQENLDIPVLGVIQPGARSAIKATQTNHIGI